MPEYRDNLQSVLASIPGRVDTSPDSFRPPLSVASAELAGGSGSIRYIDQDLVVTISGNVTEGQNPNDIRLRSRPTSTKPSFLTASTLESGRRRGESRREFVTIIGDPPWCSSPSLIGLMSRRLSWQYCFLSSGLGLMVTGTPFGIMMTGLGVISLAGVVVNNAIVLLDYIEQLRERGLNKNKR